MARAAAPTAAPTQARPVHDDGRVLDGHGLPIGGPARMRALAGKPDPALAEPAAAEAKPAPTEKQEK